MLQQLNRETRVQQSRIAHELNQNGAILAIHLLRAVPADLRAETS
jgi:hypothetical protein